MQSFFVSSTFKDMQGERDALHRTVMPRLREKATQNGDNLQFVDLRWGISTSDLDNTESTSKILSVCLREVQNCKPYMIVLLGQRYGWIPPVEQIRESGQQMDFVPEDPHISVTELEIRFGMYVAQGQLERCVFCLREPLEEDALTPEQKAIYLAADDDDARRMNALRERILNTPGAQVIRYRLECHGGELTGYEAFSEQLYTALETLLAPRWEARKALSWQQRQRKEDAIIYENHLRNFVQRKDTLQQVTDAVRYNQIVMLEGEGGCGKSALMAKLTHMYRQANYHTLLLFCGASAGCMTVQQMMRLMLWYLEVIGNKLHLNVEDDRLQEHFRKQMQSYDGPTCIFFIDALDQLAPDQALFESRFLPPEMSKSIRLILSTTGAVRVDPSALSGYTFRKILLEPPSDTELEAILHARFATEHKQISQKVAQKLLENPCSKNMLGMEIMARRLVMLGQKDFAEINRLEQTMSGAEAIDTYLLQLIEKLSSDLNQLIIDYFFDVSRFLDEEDYMRTAMLLYLIGIMQHGISAQELGELAHYVQTEEIFHMIPRDHPWMHFWDPICFARLKRYMGGLLVQRSNGSIDLSHRLLRQALRTSGSFNVIAPILRCWLFDLPAESDQRLENLLPVSRMAETDNLYCDDPKQLQTKTAQAEMYFRNPIATADQLDTSGDPEGKRQLEILIRSVLQDLTGADQDSAAATYCNVLHFLIENGSGPNHYPVWFFGSKVAAALSRLGQPEKACALRLMSAILAALHKQKDALEAGEEPSLEPWSAVAKRRFLFFHCHTLQKMADLRMDFQLGNVKLSYYDGMTADVIFEKGIALADECIREDPTSHICWLRKASLYAAYAKQTASGGNLGIVKPKSLIHAQAAFDCIRQAFAGEVTDFFREYALYIMAICAEAILMEGSGSIFGNKRTLDFGIEMCRKTWDLVTQTGDLQNVPPECTARLRLAWSRCLDAQGDRPACLNPDPWWQESLELCAQGYLDIRRQTERILNQADRKYLGLLGVQACLLMLYGYTSQAMTDAGYSRTQALHHIATLEGGYFRAEARQDFESRWNWAVMLCAEACSSNLQPKAGLETTQRAISLLSALYKAANNKGFAVDVSSIRIEHFLKFMKKRHAHYEEKVNAAKKA